MSARPTEPARSGFGARVRRFLRGGERTTGLPPSSNGASSLHLAWEVPAGSFTAAAVDLEVLEPPVVPRLYFWAMQVDWVDDRGRRSGGAHIGLQWHPGHPGSTAVNWGGYDHRGVELGGSESPLPSSTGNPNTRDLAWQPGVRYRLGVARAEDRDPAGGAAAWAGSVSWPGGGVHVRDLHVVGSGSAPGTGIVSVSTWSEVFARCDDPTVAVRWSAPELDGAAGGSRPAAVRTSYQSHADGGCANTDSSVDEVGLVQRTATTRVNGPGTRLVVPG